MTTSTYLTAAEAAEVLGISVQRIKQRLAQGQIAGAFKVGRDWAIPAPVTYVNLPYPDNPHQRGRRWPKVAEDLQDDDDARRQPDNE